MNNSRLQKERSQAIRLKNAYNRMLEFEKERQHDRYERVQRSQINSQQKTKRIASNFQQAENIR